MKSRIGWILAIIFGLALIFLLPSFLMGRFWHGGFDGMMGGPGMMGWYGFMNPVGFLGMALMWLILVGLLVLAVVGIVSLVKGVNRPSNIPLVERKCAECGRAAQADWSTCPYCGKPLA